MAQPTLKFPVKSDTVDDPIKGIVLSRITVEKTLSTFLTMAVRHKRRLQSVSVLLSQSEPQSDFQGLFRPGDLIRHQL